MIPKKVKKSEFCPFCTANHHENIKDSSLKWETEFASRSVTDASGKVLSHSLHKRSSKLLQVLPENH